MLNLKLGDVVSLGGQSYVVATVTGLPPSVWQLVLVPAGQAPLDLGKTWTRAESESLNLIAPTPPPPSAALDDPTTDIGSPAVP